MPRQKMYFRYEIPSGVVDVVRAICADYDRRERVIRFSSVAGPALAKCVELNAAIDKALEEVEFAIRKDLLRDVGTGRGYAFSPASAFLAKNTYYQRKKRLVYDIAKELSLI